VTAIAVPDGAGREGPRSLDDKASGDDLGEGRPA